MKLRLFKNRKNIILTAVFLVVLVAMAVMYYRGEAVEVEAVTPLRGNIKDIVEETGQVEVLKKQEVYALYGGKLKSIPVEVGQQVKKGELLLEFDLEDLKIRLEQAKAQLTQVRESGGVGAELAAASAAVKQAEINKEQAEKELNRISALYEEGAVSDREYQQAVNAYNLACAQLESATAALEAAENGQTAHSAAISSANAQVALIQKQMEEGVARAEMNGIVLEKNFDKGTVVPPGSLILKIGDPDKLQVKCMFLASEAIDIEEGNPVIIKGDVLKGKELEGRVEKIFPQAVKVISPLGIEQQRVPVEISLLGQAEGLKPGFSVDVEVVTEEADGALMVPQEAVFEIEQEHYVFIVEEGKALLRKVAKGIENKDWVQVVEGLDENDQVIVDPPNKLQEGTPVKLKK